MNILQVGTFPYPSPQGSQVYVQGIVRGLASRGHNVELMCYGHGVGDTDEERVLGVRLLRTPQFNYNNMRAGPDITKIFLDLIMAIKFRHTQPDVIHVHNYEAPVVACFAKLLFRHVRGVPLVYSAHNTMQDELPTYLPESMYKIAETFGKVLDRTIPRQMDHCIVLRGQSETILKGLGCSSVTTVMPGIDPQEFHSKESLRPLIPRQMRVGKWVVYAGNPDEYQDLGVLMSVMDRFPEVNLVFVSASDSSRWERKNGQVYRVQTTDFSLVQAIISAAQIAIVPRQNCTGFPIKVLNYLALGTVTICAEGSSVDLPGVIPVPNGDVDGFCQELQYWLDNLEECETLGYRASQYVKEHCTWDAQAEKLERIYTGLLKR